MSFFQLEINAAMLYYGLLLESTSKYKVFQYYMLF